MHDAPHEAEELGREAQLWLRELIELLHVLRLEVDGERAQVLVELVERPRTDDGARDARSPPDPRERDARRRRVDLPRDARQLVDDRVLLLAELRNEAALRALLADVLTRVLSAEHAPLEG